MVIRRLILKKYKVAICICYLILLIVCVIDIVFRFHGLLGLPVCVVQSVVVLHFAEKIGLCKKAKEDEFEKTYEPIVDETDKE